MGSAVPSDITCGKGEINAVTAQRAEYCRIIAGVFRKSNKTPAAQAEPTGYHGLTTSLAQKLRDIGGARGATTARASRGLSPGGSAAKPQQSLSPSLT